jgi:hypothetical protein
MLLIPNKHKIYNLYGGGFLIVYKVRGESPTRWQKSILNSQQLYDEIVNHYGVENAFLNYFKDNNELHLLFSLSNDFETFLNSIDKLKLDTKITNLLNSSEVHLFSIDSYNKLDKNKKFDCIYNVQQSKVYIFVN